VNQKYVSNKQNKNTKPFWNTIGTRKRI